MRMDALSENGATVELDFDPDQHRYKLGSHSLLSVTQIIESAGLIDTSWYDSEDATRGTYIHEATALYDEGRLDEATIDERVAPYLEAWKNFRKCFKGTILLVEQAVCHIPFGVAGMIDRAMIEEPLERYIIDIKAGQPQPWHRLQTAGYKICWGGSPEAHRACVYLRNDGTFLMNIHPHEEDDYDRVAFLSCLNVASWRQKHDPRNIPNRG